VKLWRIDRGKWQGTFRDKRDRCPVKQSVAIERGEAWNHESRFGPEPLGLRERVKILFWRIGEYAWAEPMNFHPEAKQHKIRTISSPREEYPSERVPSNWAEVLFVFPFSNRSFGRPAGHNFK